MTAKVVKLAQPGFDVKTAGDENLIYNSNWPLLKIFHSDSYSTSNVSSSLTIFNHNLGYPPMFWVYTNEPINSWNFSQTTPRDTRAEFLGISAALGFISVDKDNLYLVSSATSTFNLNVSFQYYIFALDLSQQFTAPIIKTGAIGGKRGNTVFKLAKEGKDISSQSLEDFAVHSDARSPLIHSVNVGLINESLGSGYAFTVHHNLGYIPMFFGYSTTSAGRYVIRAAGGGGGTNFITADAEKIQWKDTIVGTVPQTIVILKDPFMVDYSVRVSI